MGIFEYFSLAAFSFVSTYFPRLTTFTYGFLGALLVMHYDPLLLCCITTLAACLGTLSLRFADTYIHSLISRAVRLKSSHHSRWPFLTRVQRFFQHIHDRLHMVSRKDVLFFLVIVWVQAAIPDLLVIRAVKHKLPFGLFLVAMIIGKIVVYAPIIYGIEFLKTIRSNIF